MKAALSILILIPSLCLAWTSGIYPASNTSPREAAWTYTSGTNTITVIAKDAWQYDCYSGLVERAAALDLFWETNLPAFYRSERENCQYIKKWLGTNCHRFLDLRRADVNGSFNAWLAASNGLPVWSSTSLISYLSLPADFFTNTGYRAINESLNGWDNVRRVLEQLVWTAPQTYWYYGLAGTNLACDVECFPFGSPPGEISPQLPILPEDNPCGVSVGVPASFEYGSSLRGEYELAGVTEQVTMDPNPACYLNPLYPSRLQTVTHEIERGYPITGVPSNAVLSNITASVDFYVNDAPFTSASGCVGGSNPPSVRFSTLLSSLGNFSDPTIGGALGSEWDSYRLYKGSDLFPENVDPPPIDTDCVTITYDYFHPMNSPCLDEMLAVIALPTNCPPHDPMPYWDGGDMQRAYMEVVSDWLINRPASVVKWNFKYR